MFQLKSSIPIGAKVEIRPQNLPHWRFFCFFFFWVCCVGPYESASSSFRRVIGLSAWPGYLILFVSSFYLFLESPQSGPQSGRKFGSERHLNRKKRLAVVQKRVHPTLGGSPFVVGQEFSIRLKFPKNNNSRNFTSEFFFKYYFVRNVNIDPIKVISYDTIGGCDVFNINLSNNFYFNPKAPPTRVQKKKRRSKKNRVVEERPKATPSGNTRRPGQSKAKQSKTHRDTPDTNKLRT
jgi:hypothetical protein